MGRGYGFGLLIGALASVLGLAGVSLMLPPAAVPVTESVAADEAAGDGAETPGTGAEGAEPAEGGAPEDTAAGMAAEPAPEVTETGAPEPAQMPEPMPGPDPAPEAEVAMPTPATAPEAGTDALSDAGSAPAPEATVPTPETPEVEVPAGSEFARPKPEEDPVLPAPEPAPATAAAPGVAQPQAEAAPQLAEVSPAAIPEGQSEAPAAPAAPESATAPAVADAPAAETAVPVPPPGEATAPPLGSEVPADTTPGIVTAEAAPEPPAAPAAAPAPEAATEQPVAETTPPAATGETAPAVTEPAALEPAVPEAAAPEPEAATPEPVVEPAAESSEMEPSEDLPAEDDGPVIIDIAPRAPIGAANAPQPGFSQSVPGVKVNRLPTIGTETPAPDVPGAEGQPPAPEIVLDAPELPVTETAVARFGARFDNPDNKPLLSVILEDVGEENGGVGPDALAAIGRPLTIAIDPERPDAAARAIVYRLAGHEVAIRASALPEGATASDLEVSYQSYVQVLPEAVALIGAPDASFQTDRRIAQHLVALLATDGRGLISYARGLNPARQAAAGAGLPHADAYRVLDAGGENTATVTRYLDRAAFEAARQGKVVVTGTSAADTVAALRDWIAAGAKGTAVGPVSAAMLFAPAPAAPVAEPEPAAEPEPEPAPRVRTGSGGSSYRP